MKKFLIVLLVIALIALAGVGIYFGLGFGRQIAESVTLPDEYYIEYEITGEDNIITTVAKGKDSTGNYYYKDSETETVFLLNGGKYTVYDKTGGQWVARSSFVNEDYINDNTEAFDSLANKSKEKFSGVYKESDGEAFLGRNCNSYKLGLNIINFSQSYEMLVDVNTGVCMRFFGTSSVNSEQTDEAGFECVKFETSGLDFSTIVK